MNDLSAEVGNKTSQPTSLLSKGIYFDRCIRLEGQREARDLTISHTLFSKHDRSMGMLLKQMVELVSGSTVLPRDR